CRLLLPDIPHAQRGVVRLFARPKGGSDDRGLASVLLYTVALRLAYAVSSAAPLAVRLDAAGDGRPYYGYPRPLDTMASVGWRERPTTGEKRIPCDLLLSSPAYVKRGQSNPGSPKLTMNQVIMTRAAI